MSLKIDDKQKSLKRRFLLILGAVTFSCVLALGLMVLFWDDIFPQYQLAISGYQRIAFGVMIILYAVLRFSRVFKKENVED